MHKISKAYLIERIFDSLLFLSKKEIYKERKFPFFRIRWEKSFALLYQRSKIFGIRWEMEHLEDWRRAFSASYLDFEEITRMQEQESKIRYFRVQLTEWNEGIRENVSFSSPLTNLRFVEKMFHFRVQEVSFLHLITRNLRFRYNTTVW